MFLKKNNPTIKYVGGFVKAKAKAEFFCEVCKNNFESQAYDVYTGHIGCPMCYKQSRGINNLIEKLNENNPFIKYLNGYIEPHKKAKFQCEKCGYIFERTAYEVYYGKSHCPNCEKESRLLSDEDIRNKLRKNNPDIEYVGCYTGSLERASFHCLKCGHKWDTFAFAVYGGKTGCPKCAFSKGEDRISRYLDSKNISYKSQHEFSDCKNVYSLPFDFYIPKMNICIEYDGEFHFMPVQISRGMSKEQAEINYTKLQKRDNIKNDYCKTNNIKLIRIPYTEFTNIEKILDKTLDNATIE